MDEETAVNNAYQTAAEDGMDAVATAAQAEFDGLVRTLRDQAITVCVREDDPDADTPDALFLNNWVQLPQRRSRGPLSDVRRQPAPRGAGRVC